MAILGLQNINNIDAYVKLKNRRMVFYTYPNGAAPLTGLLSMMDDEVTDTPEFGWWEHRYVERATTLAAGSQIYTAANKDDLASSTASTSPVTFTAGTFHQLRFVTDGVNAAALRVGDILTLFNMGMTVGSQDLKVLVTAVDYTNLNRVTVRVLETPTSTVVNSAANNAKIVRVTGSAHEEGGVSYTRISKYPVNPRNFTQIFRTPFSFTRTALKAPLEWDKTGIYKHDSKDRSLDHMIQIENSVLTGVKQTFTAANPDGEMVPTRTMGGLEWYLRQWELGSIANGAPVDYRPGGTVATLNTDPNKRIIDLTTASNTATRAEFEGWLQRVFAESNNKSNEKICFCGSGFLSAVNTAYERLITVNKNMGMVSQEVYGMEVVGVQTVHGKVWFKSHPLLSKRADMNYNGFILDLGNIKYRYLQDSDTTLLKNRQNPGEDRRRDEWLTECGLEVRFPESHIYIKSLQTITA